ncbi:EAL and HDOD domain-containing protein [Denitromonas iodatirespirans]|uniref:HDOD domain-containing protein n=1 Tax=Denitromonas iodatirespirans TaxID=2795389 RepID=A0A944H9V1_DENI1|nr:HDOD domain-containing protein [Denitromonas iodatirespirans]MBT0963609.1 HDOD domain-containing protein [Denitromonas iodatirespirans]
MPQPAPLPDAFAAAGGVLMWQAVVGPRAEPLGYRFFCSATDMPDAGSPPPRVMRDTRLIQQVAALSPGWRRRRQLFVELDAEALDVEALVQLGGQGANLILDSTHRSEPAGAATRQAIDRLRAIGFAVFLEARDDGPWLSSLVGQAGSLALRFGAAAIDAPRLQAAYPGVAWCALDVPTLDDMLLAQQMGCVAITGPVVSARTSCLGGRFSPDGLRVTSLLSQLRQGAEIREMAGVLKQDVALSYRLLRYVNAAAWGMTTPISSIEHALLMLGRRPLYRWLMLLLLAGAPKAALTEVRGEATLVRARFMELLGESLHVSQRDELFVLGMLSQLDTVLQVPVPRVLDTLPMSATVRAALGDAAPDDSPYAPYLALARAWDDGDSAAVLAGCARLGLAPEAAARCHLAAFEWVLENGQ